MKRFWMAAWLTTLLAAGPAGAAETVALTVSAGKHDRINVPVCVLLEVPAAAADWKVARIEQPGDGKPLVGQLTRPGLLAEARPAGKGRVRSELHFVLPSLKAGKTLSLRATLDEDLVALPVFAWRDTPGQFSELALGDRPVLRYVYRPLDDSTPQKREETYKVFHHLYDPAGKRLVTKGPGGQFTHHRGLFYGFRKVGYGAGAEVDTWHCTGDTHLGHEKFLAEESGPVLGRHRILVSWHGKGNEVFAREQREVTAYNVPGGTLIEWASRLETAGGPVTLDGDPQHAGFHFRADNEVAAKTSKQTVYTRPDGTDQPGKTRNWPDVKTHVNLPWDAMTFTLGDQKFTAAYLDRPDNPREARFSERDYGRFGSYFVTEVTDRKPLAIRYRVWLQEGPMTPAEVAARSADFVEPVEVAVK
jgi:hypothetical protein